MTTPNRLLPGRSALAAPVRPLASGRRDAEPALLRARGFDDVLDPLGPRRARRALPLPGEDRQPRDDARRRRPAVKRPVWILHVFVVGLALHNFVMAELYAAGVRGNALDVVSAWKEAAARARARCSSGAIAAGRCASTRALVDWLALGYGAFVVVYGDPPAALARRRRHPSRCRARRPPRPAPGRRVLLRPRPRPDGSRRAQARRHRDRVGLRRRGLRADRHLRDPALVVAQLGRARLVHASSSASPTQGLSQPAARTSSTTPGTSTVFRRLVSIFLSPLATSYMFVTALLLCAAWWIQLRPKLAVWIPTVALLFAGLLWTHSRSSYLALAVGLVVFAILRPQWRVALVGAAVARGRRRVRLREGLPAHRARRRASRRASCTSSRSSRTRRAPPRPSGRAGSRTRAPRATQEPASTGSRPSSAIRRDTGPGTPARPLPAPTSRSRPASRPTPSSASTPGSLGGLLFVAWLLTVLVRLFRCTAWLSAAMVAMLVLGLQTDIIGVPWVVYVLWPLAGWRMSHPDSDGPRHGLKSVLRPAGTCLPWKGCGSRSSTSRSAPRPSVFSRSR